MKVARGAEGRMSVQNPRLCGLPPVKKRAASPDQIGTHSPVKLLISVFSYSVLRLRSQPTSPAPIPPSRTAPGAGITPPLPRPIVTTS